MNLHELTTLLRECAGEAEGVDLDGDVLDTPLAVLGYDSLAVLQTTGHIEREYDIVLSDDTLAEAHTPRLLLEYINESLAQSREQSELAA